MYDQKGQLCDQSNKEEEEREGEEVERRSCNCRALEESQYANLGFAPTRVGQLKVFIERNDIILEALLRINLAKVKPFSQRASHCRNPRDDGGSDRGVSTKVLGCGQILERDTNRLC